MFANQFLFNGKPGTEIEWNGPLDNWHKNAGKPSMSPLVYLSTLVVVVLCCFCLFVFYNLKEKNCAQHTTESKVAWIIICPFVEEIFRSIWILRANLEICYFFPLVEHVCPALISVWEYETYWSNSLCERHTTRSLGTLSQWVLRDELKSKSAGRCSKYRTPT